MKGTPALFAASLALALALPAAARSTPPSAIDARGREVLHAMNNTSTWGHPDQYGEFQGMRYYARGDYAHALKYFRIGARYADKLSQLSIGLMYLNGEGVQKDPVEAFAWIAIAAERKYPGFLHTRDSVWTSLDAGQRERAKREVARLYAEYGDAVAKPRMAHELRRNVTLLAGSMLGTSSDTVARSVDNIATCGDETIGGAPEAGCGGRAIYQQWRWDPGQYFAARDAEWTGQVTIGSVARGAGAGKPGADRSQPARQQHQSPAQDQQ